MLEESRAFGYAMLEAENWKIGSSQLSEEQSISVVGVKRKLRRLSNVGSHELTEAAGR